VKALAVPRAGWAEAFEQFGIPKGHSGPAEEMFEAVNAGCVRTRRGCTERRQGVRPARIRREKFRSLAEPWADTATSTGRLMIAVLGGLADVERDLIRTRTAEGRSRAKARGQHMGRPSKLTDAQKAEARRRRAEGATLKELAQSYDVGLATISRLSA
jgi:DNA invertase Pin-like site-specific DNA recombinase